MNEQQTPEFVINDEYETDDEHAASVRSENKDLRIQRLNTRVTLITILIPILIGAISYLGYMDISKKVVKVHDTGSTEVSTLSKDLESKFSNLSLQMSEIEDSLNKKARTINETLGKQGAQLDNINKKLKTQKKDIDFLAVSKKKTDNKFAPIQNDIDSLQKELQSANTSITKDINEITYLINNMKKDLISFKAQLGSLTSSKLNKEVFNAEFSKLEKNIEKHTARLDKKIISIEKKINSNPISKPAASKKPEKSTVKKASAPNKNTIQMTKNNDNRSKPSNSLLIEQEIPE